MSTGWTSRYALRTKSVTSSQIRELLKITQKPGMISFGGGLPAPDVFPIQRFEEACHKVLTEQAASALQYGETEGYGPLRELIANNMARYGIKAKVENVLITSGSQQALDLIGKLFINAGDRVLVEAPTYLGALQAFTVYGAEYVSVPIDENGLRTDLLEKPLRSGPKFMYVLPNFQNPAGTTLSEGRRHELVLLADKYGIPIIEDDPYGQLRYEGEHLPSLVVLDRENLRRDNGYSIGNVIYLSTFSKTLAPGLRLGWIVAPPEVISKLAQLKQGADLHTSTFTQFVAYEVARDGFLDKHVKLIRKIYRERRDVMLQALEEFFPPEVTWTHPQGGLFLWVTLPAGIDIQAIFKSAIEQNVAFVPGDSFYANDPAGRLPPHALELFQRRSGADTRGHPPFGRGGEEPSDQHDDCDQSCRSGYKKAIRNLGAPASCRLSRGHLALADGGGTSPIAAGTAARRSRDKAVVATPSRFFPRTALLQHKNILPRAHLLQHLRPHRDADFPKMSFAEQQHQRPRLPDSSADRERNLVVQDRLMIGQLHEVQLFGHRKLLFQRLGRNSNAHRRQFMAPPGNRVPYQDVAIQSMRVFAGLIVGVGDPVVVIGGAHLVRIAVL